MKKKSNNLNTPMIILGVIFIGLLIATLLSPPHLSPQCTPQWLDTPFCSDNNYVVQNYKLSNCEELIRPKEICGTNNVCNNGYCV